MMTADNTKIFYIPLVIFFSACVTFFLLNKGNFLLFHFIVEFFCVFTAAAIFMITFNTYKFLPGNFIRVAGIAYLFVGFIDLIHTASYKGMNLFPVAGANLPSQLWIAGRYLEAFALCGAFVFIKQKVAKGKLFLLFLCLFLAIIALIFFGLFPDCYEEGMGLTNFKIISEYLIIGLFCVSFVLVQRNRKGMKKSMVTCFSLAILFSIISEFCFTLYIGVYDHVNMLGHYFRLLSYYFMIRPILIEGVKNPVTFLFYRLKTEQQYLLKHKKQLAKLLEEKNKELETAEFKLDIAHQMLYMIQDKEEIPQEGLFRKNNEIISRSQRTLKEACRIVQASNQSLKIYRKSVSQKKDLLKTPFNEGNILNENF